MRSQSGLGSHMGKTWRPRAPRRPLGRHFGPLGARCWPLRGSILEGARGPPRSVQEALGNPCWDNVDSFFLPCGHLGQTWRLGAPRRPSGRQCRPLGARFWPAPSWDFPWTSRASQFLHDLAANTPEHQAPQAQQESAVGAQPLEFLCLGRDVSCAGLLIFFVRAPACFPLSLRCFLDLTDTRANVGTMLNVVFTLPEPIAAPSWESMYGQC